MLFKSLAAALAVLSVASAKMIPIARNNATGDFDIPTEAILAREGKRTSFELPANRATTWTSQKWRGVNIGSWLVAEPFITPSLFENTGDTRVIDEYTMGLYVSDACSRLESHWASWITQTDFQQIAAAGLNIVRIPIGYWAIDDTHYPYCKGSQLDYLTKAVGWASAAGLKVVIDLHGALASQNGFDNSGHYRPGNPGWFKAQSNADRTKATISVLAKKFTTSQYADTVVAIELLNEPLSVISNDALTFLKKFYKDTYSTVRNALSSSSSTSAAVMISDGFQALTTWPSVFTSPKHKNIVLDTHIYSVFDTTVIRYTHKQRLQFYCDKRSSSAASAKSMYTIVGEWSNAPTDCAKYLNGRGQGARYDGTFTGSSYVGSCKSKTGSGSSFPTAYKKQLKELFDTQRSVYEGSTSGWIIWAWKMEPGTASEWSYKVGLKYGWITKNLDDPGSVMC